MIPHCLRHDSCGVFGLTPAASVLPARRTRLPPLLELRSFGGGAWQAGQGIAVDDYGFTLDALYLPALLKCGAYFTGGASSTFAHLGYEERGGRLCAGL